MIQGIGKGMHRIHAGDLPLYRGAGMPADCAINGLDAEGNTCGTHQRKSCVQLAILGGINKNVPLTVMN